MDELKLVMWYKRFVEPRICHRDGNCRAGHIGRPVACYQKVWDRLTNLTC